MQTMLRMVGFGDNAGSGFPTIVAAWGYELKQPGGNDAKAKDFVGKLYRNVKVMDSAARASMTTFAERGIGDVLLTWENEALITQKTLGKNKFDIIYPSISILTEPSVAIVNKTEGKASKLCRSR